MKVQRIAWLVVLALVLAAACSGDDSRPNAETGQPNVIAFGAQGPDGNGLYFVRPDGLGLTLLSAEEEPLAVPVWSPAGGRIAYATGPADGPRTLRVYDFATLSSATVSSLAVAGAGGESSPSASWSPDGRRLAFSELSGDDARIQVFELASGERVAFPAVAGVDPDWSPDGDSLAFVRVGEGRGLYVMDADGRDPELLVAGRGQLRSPRWSPDGSRIVVTELGEDGDDAILIVERASGANTRLPGVGPAWSPDGTMLAFSAFSEGRQTDLDVFYIAIDATGVGERQPLGQAVTRDLWSAWSPDGARVVFISQVDRQTALICLVTLEPEQRDCLSLPNVLPSAPAWSPA